MGVGIGGDYPLSAVMASEFSATKIRGRIMTAVFAAQGWGNFSESGVAASLSFDLTESKIRSRCHCLCHYRRSVQERRSRRQPNRSRTR
jgi:hypothetical protein